MSISQILPADFQAQAGRLITSGRSLAQVAMEQGVLEEDRDCVYVYTGFTVEQVQEHVIMRTEKRKRQ
eukprot:7002808-Heterocapsa_arctica.AAC.1